jgi:hypothetical protein
MASARREDGRSGPAEWAWVESAWERVKTLLATERHRIHEEIKNYPRPIPACDLQFNYLLEERTSIAQELGRAEEAAEQSRKGGDPVALLREFLRSSRHLDDGAKRGITSSLKEGLSPFPT